MLPPEEARRELVREWLAKADEDIHAARILLAGVGASPAIICFHAQQATEKALKGLLTWRQIAFPKTHSILQLLQSASSVDESAVLSLQEAASLTVYAVHARYPGTPGPVTIAVARQAFDLACRVRAEVMSRLEGML